MKNDLKNIIEKIRPYLQMDGGDIEFIDYQDNYVYVRLLGNCINCMSQDETINNTIYEFIKDEFPDIEGVINISL